MKKLLTLSALGCMATIGAVFAAFIGNPIATEGDVDVDNVEVNLEMDYPIFKSFRRVNEIYVNGQTMQMAEPNYRFVTKDMSIGQGEFATGLDLVSVEPTLLEAMREYDPNDSTTYPKLYAFKYEIDPRYISYLQNQGVDTRTLNQRNFAQFFTMSSSVHDAAFTDIGGTPYGISYSDLGYRYFLQNENSYYFYPESETNGYVFFNGDEVTKNLFSGYFVGEDLEETKENVERCQKYLIGAYPEAQNPHKSFKASFKVDPIKYNSTTDFTYEGQEGGGTYTHEFETPQELKFGDLYEYVMEIDEDDNDGCVNMFALVDAEANPIALSSNSILTFDVLLDNGKGGFSSIKDRWGFTYDPTFGIIHSTNAELPKLESGSKIKLVVKFNNDTAGITAMGAAFAFQKEFNNYQLDIVNNTFRTTRNVELAYNQNYRFDGYNYLSTALPVDRFSIRSTYDGANIPLYNTDSGFKVVINDVDDTANWSFDSTNENGIVRSSSINVPAGGTIRIELDPYKASITGTRFFAEVANNNIEYVEINDLYWGGSEYLAENTTTIKDNDYLKISVQNSIADLQTIDVLSFSQPDITDMPEINLENVEDIHVTCTNAAGIETDDSENWHPGVAGVDNAHTGLVRNQSLVLENKDSLEITFKFKSATNATYHALTRLGPVDRAAVKVDSWTSAASKHGITSEEFNIDDTAATPTNTVTLEYTNPENSNETKLFNALEIYNSTEKITPDLYTHPSVYIDGTRNYGWRDGSMEEASTGALVEGLVKDTPIELAPGQTIKINVKIGNSKGPIGPKTGLHADLRMVTAPIARLFEWDTENQNYRTNASELDVVEQNAYYKFTATNDGEDNRSIGVLSFADDAPLALNTDNVDSSSIRVLYKNPGEDDYTDDSTSWSLNGALTRNENLTLNAKGEIIITFKYIGLDVEETQDLRFILQARAE